jgi:hypothetical protein
MQSVSFQALTAASMKFRVYWDVGKLKWADVTEVHKASIIRGVHVSNDGGSMHL